jgi:hypothetical protein
MSGDHTKYHGTAEVPKREWVGLTEEEIAKPVRTNFTRQTMQVQTPFNRGYCADAMEAKLKEKNT